MANDANTPSEKYIDRKLRRQREVKHLWDLIDMSADVTERVSLHERLTKLYAEQDADSDRYAAHLGGPKAERETL